MVRNTAREIAIHLSYELSFTDKTVEALLDERLTSERFSSLAGEDILYQSRTAFNDANSFHNSNYATFHRISHFREIIK